VINDYFSNLKPIKEGEKISPFENDERFDRAMGSFLGMPIGDSLGAPFEFSSVRYGIKEMKEGFSEINIWTKPSYNRFRLKPGQWTDDASMGLCLADSLLSKEQFDGVDLRVRFHWWWNAGYCNAFGYDDLRSSKTSVGLGGNISSSMTEFSYRKNRGPRTKAGDKNTSGNGSIMRNAAVPLYFSNDIEAAQKFARKQSRTTHQGDEAAECCRLLTFTVVKLLDSPFPDPVERKNSVLSKLGEEFTSKEPSVMFLAKSGFETKKKKIGRQRSPL